MSGQVWLSSDFHLGHKNIVLGCTKWKNTIACRNFQTLEEHDNTIINSINKYVKKDDILYFLGDFAMGGKENVWKYRKMINCSTIHFVLGNHDLHVRKNSISENPENRGQRAQDLFTSVQERIFKKIGKINYFMDHYASRTWASASKGTIMLHGHSHDNLPLYERLIQIADDDMLFKTGDYFKQADVGLESALRMTGEMRPFHIGEIRENMENRVNLDIDHHQEE